MAITFNSRVTDHIARVGVNYLFGGPVPVRAAYLTARTLRLAKAPRQASGFVFD